MFGALDHVLMFVPSVRLAAEWYATALRLPVSFFDENFAAIAVGPVQLCFHTADAKVPAGRAGQVVYWRVPSLRAAVAHFQSAGAALYRGPLAIEADQGICQFADPFGNLFGLVGAYAAQNERKSTMTTAIIFHEVQDGEAWANAWKKGPQSRHEMFAKLGIKCRTFRDPGNPNATGLIAEIPDMAKFQALLQSDEGATAMREDGLKVETMRMLVEFTP